MVDIIMKSESPITLISIGPMTNIAAALELEPKIKDKVKLVAMQGSVRKGYNGSSTPIIEYNVRKDIAAGITEIRMMLLLTILSQVVF
jgi:inosine-uridine nucleoside N-ribohydrolase